MTEPREELSELTLFFAEDFNLTIPSAEMNSLLDTFNQHFIKDGVLFEGQKIWVKQTRSNIRLFYAFPSTFVHIITQEIKNGQREFDQARAKRIHWIKPILLNCTDDRVLVFEREHDSGKPQIYFWYRNLSYVVILRALTENKQLLTAFCVERLKSKQFERWFNERPINKKPHIMCGARNLRHCD